MVIENSAENPPPRRRHPRWIPLVLAALLLLIVGISFFNVGHWLVVEDPLEKCQAIVVLSGRMPFRALEAAKLYRQGYASEVWLTHSTGPGATLEAMQIPFVGEDSYNLRVLVHEGVPQSAIHIIEPPIVNTADELAAVDAELQKQNGSTVIIVTSKVHTRRVRILWRKISTGHSRAVIRAVSDDPFEPKHWWRNTSDALDVVREVLGILNAWAGMPLRPAN
jgi:uncharacterized SAM-binding protein YcdF (DUF218 family)